MENQVLCSLFLRGEEKRGAGNRSVINRKELKNSILYAHFKMEGLFLLKELLMSSDLMCKIDLLCSSISERLSKYVRFQWKGSLYKFLCFYFGLSLAPRIFTKLTKVPISLLRKH